MENREKILVINLLHIGDIVLMTPFLQSLRAAFKLAHISVLVDKKTAPILEGITFIDRLLQIDKKGYHNRLCNYLKFALFLRKENFTKVVNLHANERATFLAVATGAKMKVGYATWGLRTFFHYYKKKNEQEQHVVESQREILLKGLEAEIGENFYTYMEISEEKSILAEKKMYEVFREKGLKYERDCKIVAINIGGTWPSKRWSIKNFAELISSLQEDGKKVFILGDAQDRVLVERLFKYLLKVNRDQLLVLTGLLDLQELAAVLRRCALLVSNDSGPAHVASAVGTPTITIFGASSWMRYAPFAKKSVSLHVSLPCQPCGLHECVSGDRECMEAISVEMVKAFVNKNLTMKDEML